MNLSAVILAGGKSLRMGHDKAWLEFNGQPLLRRALSTLRDANFQEIFISGRAGADYSGLECPVLWDLRPRLGPLAGIERGLHAAKSPLVLVLAVDLPFLSPRFLRSLAARCDRQTGAVPVLDGELEPLAAIYPKRCHALTLQLLEQPRRAARGFAAACLREQAVRAFNVAPEDADNFANWNSPADVAAYSQPAAL